MTEVDARYPIGRFRPEPRLTAARRTVCIGEIATLPSLLREVLRDLGDGELDSPYRPNGWTVRQVVHHIADSHINAYVRFRLALTEESPPIKPYDEVRWAELPDVAVVPIGVSVALVEALHARWAALLAALSPDQFARELFHPEYDRRISLDEMLGLYAWHGRHHVAHIDIVRSRHQH